MKRWLAILLCFNAGFVDAAGFVALGGLFAAHVTGNIVTIAASLAHGHAPALAKVIAMPVFAVVVIIARQVSRAAAERGKDDFRLLMACKLVLLAHAGLVAVQAGPFPDADAPGAIMMGMTLVSAMALQNALHRTHLTDSPPSTMMTGTFTQMLVDLSSLWRPPEGADMTATRSRLGRMSANLAAFAAGCAAAALLYLTVGMWCLLIPAFVAVAEIFALGPDPQTQSTA
ncbi:YoaK family protein [Xanthobacter sp. KR7-65]|uniref:YoaK family protein n=1 Tax=Xanthobacter sp. KR7-65 TaxID=3156612 RepID=UPI0032B3AF0A